MTALNSTYELAMCGAVAEDVGLIDEDRVNPGRSNTVLLIIFSPENNIRDLKSSLFNVEKFWTLYIRSGQ